MRYALFLQALLSLSFFTLAGEPAMQPPAERRQTAQALMQQNNFREAADFYETLLREPAQDPQHASDLEQAVHCLIRLGEMTRAEQLIEEIASASSDRFEVLRSAARSLEQLPHYGFLIGGNFHRGNHRGGGIRVSSEARDRVRSLQLLRQAIQLETAPANERSAVWMTIAERIGDSRFSAAWRLQELTNLDVLPETEEQTGFRGFPGGGGAGGGAPIDSEGNPVFHTVPESWDAAISDGQRYRFALEQAATLNTGRRSEVDLQFARFLKSQFGVASSSGFPPPVILKDQTSAQDPNTTLPLPQTLTDDQTIARLASGLKVLTLPDEFNFLSILRSIASRRDSQQSAAIEELIGEYMQRHQYPKAAEQLRQLRDVVTPQPKQHVDAVNRRLQQIEGNWLQFQPTETQAAGKSVTFDLRYRNGSEVKFTAAKIRVENLLTDIMEYIKSQPLNPAWQKTSLQTIGWHLINDDENLYTEPAAVEWSRQLAPPEGHFDAVRTMTAPLPEAGAWWITAQMKDGNRVAMVIWAADLALAIKHVEAGSMYYVADAATGSPMTDCSLQFFGWQRVASRQAPAVFETTMMRNRTNEQGICVIAADQNDRRKQWLAIARSPDGRVAFHGFHNVWNPQEIPQLSGSRQRVFAITDRPIYRPGHKLQYRLWLRNPDFTTAEDDSPGTDVIVQVRNPKGDVVHHSTGALDKWGGIDGEWTLPDDAATGKWSVALAQESDVTRIRVIDGQRQRVLETAEQMLGSGQFSVEEYRKPEFEVTIDAPETPVTLGETFAATVKARYFFGAPVTSARVKYTIERSSFSQRWFPVSSWDWLYEPGYWWFGEKTDWHPGFSEWGCLPPPRPWWNWNPDPPETVSTGEAEIGPDGMLTIPIDTAAAGDLHGDTDHRYTVTVEVTDRSRRTIVGTGTVTAARAPFKVFTWLNRGHYRTGADALFSFQARTPDGRPVAATGTALLSRLSTIDGELREEQVESWKISTTADGFGNLRLQLPAAGQFRLEAELRTADGISQRGATVFLVRGDGEEPLTWRFNALELTPDEKEYAPGETVQLQVSTDLPNSTVLLFLRPANGLCPAPQLLNISGKSTVVQIPVTADDQPNFFVEALTIAGGKVHSEIREIVVPPEERVTSVDVRPSAERGRPGDTARVQVSLKDVQGNPITGNVVVSVYDASLEAIAADTIPEIRSFFWKFRRSHSLQINSSLTRVEQSMVRSGEPIMTPLSTGEQLLTHGEENSWFGNQMLRRGAVVADSKAPMKSAEMAMDMPAMASAKAGFGGAAPDAVVEPVLRSQFAETAFWTATSTADANGNFSLEFPLPDNLTTWKIQVWTMADGTRVGSGSSEIVASKDLLIRPQTPRFLTATDRIVCSAVVHNYLDTDKTVRVVLQTDGNQLQALSPLTQDVLIKAGGEARVDWLVRAEESGEAVIRMQALTDEESDAVLVTLPVNIHGMSTTESFTGVLKNGTQNISRTFSVPQDRIADQSRLEIRYSPTLAMAMADALPWLIEYPHGCTEQTLNRFLPAVLVQRTLQQSGLDLEQIRGRLLQLNAQRTYRGKYPKHWGDPPARQTRDLRELPAGFGRGSSTLAAWIQEKIESDMRTGYGLSEAANPVYSVSHLEKIVTAGITRLNEMQLRDGGWGWFSGFNERSSPQFTALIVRGLFLARNNQVEVPEQLLSRGVQWLQSWQEQELEKLRRGDERRQNPDANHGNQPYRMSASNLDALVAQVLVEFAESNPEIDDYLYRDRGNLTAYGMALTGLVFDSRQAAERRDMLIRNLRQFVARDHQNQTAWLQLPESSRWYWYGSENEAMAIFLKLLLRTNPTDPDAPAMVKYLLNNRSSNNRWESTRDTAMVVEAFVEYLKATGEDKPDMTVEIVVDNEVRKSVRITSENLFSFDNTLLLQGDELTAGEHVVELRRSGAGPVYLSGWMTNFSLEEQIAATGLEVRVNRRFYVLEPEQKDVTVRGSRGQAVQQQTGGFRRIPLDPGASVPSGTLVEVELLVESKNDYEYLLLEDHKPAGCEPDDQLSGYVFAGLHAYREFRDDRVCFFIPSLARGQHSLSYRVRAETPGQVSALPATIEGVYAPELIGNSDEMKLQIKENE